jgi:hypothetical protein
VKRSGSVSEAAAYRAMVSARTFVCSGEGSPCAVCATVITRGELAFELEFKRPTPPFVAVYELHPRCYAAWQLERTRDPSGSTPSAARANQTADGPHVATLAASWTKV